MHGIWETCCIVYRLDDRILYENTFCTTSKVLFIIRLLLIDRIRRTLFSEYMRKHDYALYKNTVLPVMLVGFADVLVISETIVDTTGCDVVDGSADTVDELISTSTALATFYISPFVCALELLKRYL